MKYYILFFVFVALFSIGSAVDERTHIWWAIILRGGSLFVLAFLFSTVVQSSTKYERQINQTPPTYYLPAEILFEDDSYTCFCTHYGNYVVQQSGLNKDTEYLLSMDSKGTEDYSDDEVFSVWEVKDGINQQNNIGQV